MITHVAIKLDGKVWSMPKPARHHNVIHYMVRESDATPPYDGEQGFLDDTGKFLNRKEALVHAVACGQITTKKTQPADMLFSEDVW